MIPTRKPEPDSILEGTVSLPQIEALIRELKSLNPNRSEISEQLPARRGKLRKVLVANRGEIAKRFFLALREEGIRSVAIVTDPDKGQSWYEPADEILYIGDPDRYSNIQTVVAATLLSDADAIYPGYGFLSEDFRFVETLEAASKIYKKNIIFMGPKAFVMRRVGNKLDARNLARENGIPLFDGSGPITQGELEAIKEAERIGYPVMVKLDAGGGGKGMVVAYNSEELKGAVESAERIGRQAYGNGTYFLEKFVEHPSHFEVQIFNSTAVGVRKCAVQRRNQKVVEESGETFLDDRTLLQLLSSAERIAHISGYSDGCGAGTVEFLLDGKTGNFGFLEMNTRLQVEYPVTDQSLGIDLAKWQILFFDGRESEIPFESVVRRRFSARNHSIQCRIYAEDPFQNYSPAPGRITELELPTFNGVRCDFGFRKGDRILGDYDPMIGKLIAFGTSREEALLRMERALSELYVKGLTTNHEQLLKLIRHDSFRNGNYDNRILNENPELTEQDFTDREEGALFCCIAESNLISEKALTDAFKDGDLPRLLNSEESEYFSHKFDLRSGDRNLQFRLFKVGFNTFEVLLNGKYFGRIGLTTGGNSGEEFTVEFRGRIIPVRVDRRSSFHSVRFSDGEGKLRFLRFTVRVKSSKNPKDNPGNLRSPFQGTFVKIADNPSSGKTWKEGDSVQEGDPLIVISAMKMETILKAPIGGELTYLAEHGDLSRLIRGATASGMILGKGFGEGEILAKIETRKETESSISEEKEIENSLDSLWENWEKIPTNSDPSNGHLPIQSISYKGADLRKLLMSWVSGTFREEEFIPKIGYILSTFKIQKESEIEAKRWETFYLDILKFHVLVRRLFSSDPGTKFSHFGEIHRLLSQWETEGYNPSKSTRKLLSGAFHSYGVQNWSPVRRTKEQKEAFLYLVRAYANLREGKEIFVKILEKFSLFAPSTRSVELALHAIIYLEEREKEPTLEKTARRILALRGNRPQKFRGGNTTISRRHVFDYIRFVKNPWSLVSEESGERLEILFRQSFKTPLPLLPTDLSPPLAERFAKKIDFWKSKGDLTRLFSPEKGQYLYLIDYGREKEYILFSAITPDPRLDLFRSALETAAKNAACILQGAQSLSRVDLFRLEIITTDIPVPFDLSSDEDRVLNYENIIDSANSVVRFFLHGLYSQFTLEIFDSLSDKIRTFSLFFKEGKLRMDIVHPNDPRFPYTLPADSKDAALFRKGKWPLEHWINETFDPSTVREILVPIADGITRVNPKTGQSETYTPGAKIFVGKMGGKDAVFFFKDSRVAGGATGDIEGRKYIASTYYAYRSDIPLYVWNDGAGANIREGMVSLNRAAEGFFMNSLLTARVNAAEFRGAIESHKDPVLREICDKMEQVYGKDFRPYIATEKPNRCFIIAIGVGSSTGLDVYGSSQASLQLLLNEEESYRVLTGSAVIESVTGEKFTNYEIGGARIMGQATGTVDFVASDKLQLLWYLHRIQEVLLGKNKTSSRISIGAQLSKEEWVVLDENELIRNSETNFLLSVKENYSGSGSLVSGFVRLGDSPVLTLGPRTSYGFHSLSCIIKAKESVRIAQKTGADLLLVYGSRWFRSSHWDDSDSLRPRRDFQKSLQDFQGVCLHLLKHPEGIRIPELTSAGDAWLLLDDSSVSRDRATKKELSDAKQWATFDATSEAEAYDKIRKFFSLLRTREILSETSNNRKIELPADTSASYDMKEKVVSRILDADSFLEFYEADPGSSLITGLGRLGGKTVAIIADQPKDGGAPDAPGTEKFRVFAEFVNKHKIPLLMISDAPGFVPGTKQERLRIQQIGGESLDVNVLSQVPVVSVVLRQNYGGRQIHAFSGFLRPGIAYYAFSDAVLAVMGASSAFDLFQGAKVEALKKEGKNDEIELVRREFLESFRIKSRAVEDAKKTGVLDDTFASIEDLRTVFLQGLAEAQLKTREWKKKIEEHYATGQIYGSRDNTDDWKDLILP
ncbi:carbamoyl-phosphate synthase L chain, ATP-binding domain protein [Leptospira fainei serovar Hurstbridge str. BUT 6]|uniref:Carbamoyl-phosphate synthase L chain, ATP-binding domain protein n=1 Tax=Leptospira fainei serovar Hurstbridge str. BUT 6 TaxID=1193011 RepID=S3W1Q8_9LEPT|nr:carboxyl transferase domain-containing protein [Leptospira fainei]EPG74242.1 carbamoyl-phosphate synthase L chain, ATP-binding domain protein [Leptospira fainei serovar Hurstbridge str. BUT 6]